MLIGSNWVLGFSHTSVSADEMIRNRHASKETIVELLEAYLEYGIDAIMGPAFDSDSALRKGMFLTEEKFGKKMTQIVTPILNMDDNAAARKEAEDVIKKCAADGAEICLIHHSSAEQLVNKNKQTMDRLPDYLAMIRDAGMVPGLSAHMPELVLYSDMNEYDVETYIQIYNCMGFLMQLEIEGVNSIIWNAKKPVMTIKSMAAGRCTPYVGITFNYATLRPCDMVTLGAFTPDEVHEDVEIALAAIERRRPVLGKRSSPARTAIVDARQ
jgi:predicted aldo/keto reductase-like oxidoreductase